LTSVNYVTCVSPVISLFIPTTPNPTTGWYAIVPEEDVLNLSISVEDAFKIVVSGGIVSPNIQPSHLPAISSLEIKQQEIPEIETKLDTNLAK